MSQVAFARPPFVVRLVPVTNDAAQDKALQSFYEEYIGYGYAIGRPGLQDVGGVAHLMLYAESPEMRVSSEKNERRIAREVTISIGEKEVGQMEEAWEAEARIMRARQAIGASPGVMTAGMPPGGIPQGPAGPRIRR